MYKKILTYEWQRLFSISLYTDVNLCKQLRFIAAKVNATEPLSIPTRRIVPSGIKPGDTYRKTSNIRHTKYQNLNASRPVLQLSLPNPLKPGVKSRMKMKLKQRRQAMLQLHLSDQQLYCLLWCNLY